ncbi:MAG: tetratricopeptide repeat protein [Syntrophales bacterium]|nr:tetratricopeptide repeat protein [Syntrophales bacterium]
MGAKITKQELKEPDRLQLWFAKVLTYVGARKKQFIMGTIAVTLVVVTTAAWLFYRQYEERQAMAAYTGAVDTMSKFRGGAQDPQKTAEALRNVVTKYGGTRAAALSSYRLGNLYLAQNNIDEALKAYQAFLAQAGRDDEITALTHAGMGYCYEAKKDYKNALASHERSLEVRGGKTFESTGYANMARVYEAMNDKNKALEFYRKALDRATDANMKEILERKIATLG